MLWYCFIKKFKNVVLMNVYLLKLCKFVWKKKLRRMFDINKIYVVVMIVFMMIYDIIGYKCK